MTSVWAEILWLTIGVGFVAYALTGGADLGAGTWDLLASGPRKEQQRDAIKHAIAPIWEANNVWLIFVIVVLFSAFPRAFAVIGTALHVPIGLALVGIVLRGAAFSFHSYGIQSARVRERWSLVFALGSVMTPVFFGMAVAGVSSGDIRVHAGSVSSGYFAGWFSAFGALTGGFALCLFALLAACYLAAESEGELSADFCRRAIACEVLGALLSAGVFVTASAAAPELFATLAGSAFSWPLQALTAGAACGALYELVRRRPRRARWYAALQVGLVVVGWGLAMDHHFVRPDVTVASAGAPPAVLRALTITLACGAVVLIPALAYLYRVFKLGR